MRLRFAATLVCLSLALVLSTVARNAQAEEPNAAIPDPCKLVTPEEAQVLLEAPVDRSSEVHVKDAVKFPIRICTFHAKNGRTLNVSTATTDAAAFATEWTGQDKIGDLGDAAYTVVPGVIAVLKGTHSCKFQALNFGFSRDGHGKGMPAPAVTARLKTIAQAALARM